MPRELTSVAMKPARRGQVKDNHGRRIAHGLDPSGRVLAIGAERVNLYDIGAYRFDGLAEKDFSSAFATATAFGTVATMFLALVLVNGSRERFLLGGGLLAILALCALLDLRLVRWVTSYTFDLTLRDGQMRRFVTADPEEAKRLKDALEATLGGAAR